VCGTADARASLLLALPDEDVGAVLGKKGQTLTQIQQVGLGCSTCTTCLVAVWGASAWNASVDVLQHYASACLWCGVCCRTPR
jgi:predicted RNA-binding protein YlqC (UPF0109 family)